MYTLKQDICPLSLGPLETRHRLREVLLYQSATTGAPCDVTNKSFVCSIHPVLFCCCFWLIQKSSGDPQAPLCFTMIKMDYPFYITVITNLHLNKYLAARRVSAIWGIWNIELVHHFLCCPCLFPQIISSTLTHLWNAIAEVFRKVFISGTTNID